MRRPGNFSAAVSLCAGRDAKTYPMLPIISRKKTFVKKSYHEKFVRSERSGWVMVNLTVEIFGNFNCFEEGRKKTDSYDGKTQNRIKNAAGNRRNLMKST